MTFRTRPVLDRKHRPRWQDELRTQQLTVAAFAVAIALAVGIFGAAAWNGYWESHFRPVAAVAGTTFDRSDLALREQIVAAETIAQLTELQAQFGGPRDQFLQQQMDSLSLRLSSLSTAATDSLVESAVLSAQADAFGVSVGAEQLDAGIAERLTLPERVAARLILVEPLPEDAEPDAEPTDEQLEAARAEAEAAGARVEGGEDFAAVAGEVSDDSTGASGGQLGWFEDDDEIHGEYFDALADADVGDIVGPVETDRGYAVLELLDRREASTEGGLGEILDQQGITDDAFRQYVRGELLVDAFRTHFTEEVAISPAPQQRVARISIAPASSEDPVPEVRARHVLISPLPDAADQTAATDEQWAAALAEATEVRELLSAEDADWFAIAEERSDDPGSGSRGGDLGWSDPAASPFVVEFGEALAALEVGELSEPVRSDFGYHVIQKTAERESPQAQAQALVEELREAPQAFAEMARTISEDHGTARDGGELGWVARYQLAAEEEEAVFALSEPNEVSEPVETASGIAIYQLLESSESRAIEADRLEQIRASGFERWLADEVRSPVRTWIDPQFASADV